MDEDKKTEATLKKGDYLREQIDALRDAFEIQFPEDELLICVRLTEPRQGDIVMDSNYLTHTKTNSNTISHALWDWAALLHPHDEDDDASAWRF